MRLLLIEDEISLGSVVKEGLESANYRVDWATTGSEGMRLLNEETFALLLLDVMLPDVDGWTICERLRRRRDATPILMLTALDSVEDRVRGLESGADDYLPKPFDFKELRARVRALLRRERVHKGRLIQIADLIIDTVTRRVLRAGAEVLLTPREYTLLEALAASEGYVLSREMVQERVWMDEECGSNTVEVYISMLRKKIDANRDLKLIRTVHGMGYMLQGPSPMAAALS
jgi:DNA-binding response OmpR family regulator